MEFVVSQIRSQDLRNVVLVSHSWGGYPATGAAHALPDRIAKVIYCNAVVPARGTAMSEENDQYAQALHAMIAGSGDGTVPLPLEAIRAGLMPNESPELQELVYGLALPQPGAYMLDAFDVPAVTEIGLSAAYVLGVDDHALARPGAEFAARIGLSRSWCLAVI